MIEKIKKIVISKYIYVVLFDILLSVFSTYLAYSLRIESYHIPSTLSINTYFICAISFIPIFIYFDIYDTNESFTSPEKLKKIIFAILTYSLFLFILFSSLKNGTPRSIAIIQPLIFFPILCISRILNSIQSSINNDLNVPNLIIYGAGEAGAQLANLIREKNTYRVIGFIDNDLKKIGKFIKNVKIYDEENISHLINKFTVKNIIIAIPSMKISDRRNLVKKLNKYNIETKILPDLNDLINHNISIDDLRELNIDDLLDREIKTNNENIHILSKKIILITGAGGSIGSELSKQIIFQNPREVILLDNSEFNLYHIQEDLKKLIEFHSPKIECKITPMLLSINNYERLELLFNEKKPEIIFHAAAYKHVNLVEINILESIRNNFFGTLNVAWLAKKYNVKNFLLISSDKAVRPTNIMGATKRLSELVIQAYASNENNINSPKIFSIVRFGNVLASSGSVINKFNNQIKNRESLTVTHPDVTRYFMTIYEAVHLILQATQISKGGEVFLLEMGKPIKIIDLAKKMVNLSGLTIKDQKNKPGDIEIQIIGLRPGEKLFEELLIDDNSVPSKNENIYYAREEFISMEELNDMSKKLQDCIKNNNIIDTIEILEENVSGFKYKT